MASTSVEATVILCDAAQAAEGKLYIIGGGWTRLQANVSASVSLGIIVHVPFDMTNQRLKLEAALRDDDGQPVEVGGGVIAGAGEFEVGRPPGTKQGEQLNFPLALTFEGLALPVGGYVWEVAIQGEKKARCPFRVV